MQECAKLWEEAKMNWEAAQLIKAVVEIHKDDPLAFTYEQWSLYVKSLAQQIATLIQCNTGFNNRGIPE